MIKSETDYVNRAFPQSASIVDFVRGSATFSKTKHLLSAFQLFAQKVSKNGNNNNNNSNNDNNNNNNWCIKDILRVKNGFDEILSWNNDIVCILSLRLHLIHTYIVLF